MKHVDINDDCYVHLIDNAIYLYVENQFIEILYVDDIENSEDPIPAILNEIELASRPSLFKLLGFL